MSPDSTETELFTGDGQDGFQRKSEVSRKRVDRRGLGSAWLCKVRPPERPTELTLVLDADNIDEDSCGVVEDVPCYVALTALFSLKFTRLSLVLQMKSIVWKFTEQGACVKALNKHCPKAWACLSCQLLP